MNPQFLISKLAANATDTAWSQSYSTLNFYVVLSIAVAEKTDTPVAQIGKETLEKLQREYFSIDEKTLDAIKQAVKNVIKSLDETVTYSLILATHSDATLYIITASEGQVVIKRNDKLGVIAKGTTLEVNAFSGPLKHNDIIVLETAAFANKIPLSIIQQNTTSNITELCEDVAPQIHDGASGAEAAIFLQYTLPEQAFISPTMNAPTEENTTKNPAGEEEIETTSDVQYHESLETQADLHNKLHADQNDSEKTSTPRTLPSFTNIPAALAAKKKLIIITAIVVLVLVLVGSIIKQSTHKKTAQNTAALDKIVTDAQADYDAGVGLEDLNRPLALDKYTHAKDLLTSAKSTYTDPGDQAKIEPLLEKVDAKVGGFTTGKKVDNSSTVLKKSDTKLTDFHTLTFKGGHLTLSDSSNGVALVKDNKIDTNTTLETKAIKSITADEDTVYVLTNDKVITVDSNGKTKDLFDVDGSRKTVDVFGSNVYLLASDKKDVEKYSPSSYSATSYFKPGTTVGATPTAMTIDGSIYLLLDNGAVKKYTRGVEDSFTLSGMQGKVSKTGMLYTDDDYTYLYILDPSNQRLLIADKTGVVKQELSWETLAHATSFAVDEASKTVYVTTSDTLYSFTY